ncbi:MAG: carboxypeptidase-like regulatory domain-containing protein [Acidobacteriota bacterium]|nr:carboxypeptidase-like regulatory domain-containing protein [Acidobacteriota bacterium]
MILPWRGAAAALAVAAAAAATVSTAQRPVPYLTGRVIDAETGVAIPGVMIRLSGRREFIATTDRDGRYWSEALPNGMYFVVASKDGYLPSEPQSPTGVPLRLRIRDGGALSVQQDWMLEPAARIRGRVLDHYDRPLAGVRVMAARRARSVDGWPELDLKASAVTAADGRFEIRGLRRGPYILAFEADSNGATRWSFSPGIADPRHASLVEAVASNVNRSVDLRAAISPLARVAVATMTTGGAPIPNAIVELTPWRPFAGGDATAPITIVTDGSGRGAFSNLPVGRHRVVARAPASPGARATSRGEAVLDLPDRLAPGLDVRMEQTQTACVFTRMETDGTARGDFESPPTIDISTRDGALSTERLEARVKLGEMASLSGLAPRSMLTLSAFAGRPLWALSRFSPAQPAPRGAVPIDAAAAGCIAVYFRRTSAHISGRIALPDSDWAPEVEVIAVPIDSDASPLAVTAMNDDGSFRITGISIGMRYRVSAVPLGIDLFAIGAADRQSLIAAGGDTITVPLSVPIAR